MIPAAPTFDGAGSRPRRRKILIVEDNDLNMKLFNDLLGAHGYDTLQTKDGGEALALARRHRPGSDPDGHSASRGLRSRSHQMDQGRRSDLKSIPIIAVTAFAMKGDREKMRDGGCEDYIAKPISVASFLQTVERFLFSI